MMTIHKATSRRSAGPGHHGIKASSAPRRVRTDRLTRLASSHWTCRAFSLAEVMLAIMILGVGVISVAALFPAGIAQQRLSVDDTLGRTIAENAIALIRTRVKPEDFGTFEEFSGPGQPLYAPRRTIPGDWPWGRPTFFIRDATIAAYNSDFSTAQDIDQGSISVFRMPVNASGQSVVSPPGSLTGLGPGAPALPEIPWNSRLYGFDPPTRPAIITQRERYYPMPPLGSTEQVRPQYVWDCMFRRFNGKILVAIFVYRVTVPGGGEAPSYAVSPNPSPNHLVPPLPIWMDLEHHPQSQGMWSTGGLDQSTPLDDHVVLGLSAGTPFNHADAFHAWQDSRQWILDVNNNIYRVVGGSRLPQDDPVCPECVAVELSRGPSAVPAWVDNAPPAGPRGTGTPYYHRGVPNSYAMVYKSVVTDIWYLPLEVQYDSDGDGSITSADSSYLLTPVYLTVKEL